MLQRGLPSLSSLEQVPWSVLGHAYGRADDLPQQIRALLDPDFEIRQNALYGFRANIWHQHSRYSATVAAIPIFIEMLRYQGVACRTEILVLLTELATGSGGPVELDCGLKKYVEAFNPHHAEPADEWMDRDANRTERVVEWECYRAVAAGCPLYGALLDEGPTIAIAASYLLAFFPLYAGNACPKLLSQAEDEGQGELVRGSALMSLSHLCSPELKPAYWSLCQRLVDQYRPDAEDIELLTGIAACCLLRDRDWFTSATDRQQLLREIANACLEGRLPSIDEEYYQLHGVYGEEEIDPLCFFPWSITSLLRQSLTKLPKTE